jgi:hypothetical protein
MLILDLHVHVRMQINVSLRNIYMSAYMQMAKREFAPTHTQFNLLIDACVREAVRGNSFAVQQGLAALRHMKEVSAYIYMHACAYHVVCI